MAAAGMRLLGSGHPPLHRFRLGLEFALSGHREVDDMIAHHAAIARTLAEQLDAVGRGGRRAGRGVRALGRTRLARRARGRGGAAAPRASRRWPSSSRWRIAWAASRRRGSSPASGAAGNSIRRCPTLVEAEADVILSGLDDAATGTPSSRPSRRSPWCSRASGSTPRCSAIANFVDLKSPYFLGHARAVAELAGEAGTRLGHGRGRGSRRSAAPGSCTASGGWGSRTRSGTSADRSAPASGSAFVCSPYLTERMLRQSEALAPMAAIAVQHRERLDGSGYPRGLSGAGISRSARILGGGGRLPGDARASPPPPARFGRRGRRRAAGRGQGGPLRRRGRRGGARRGRPSRLAAPRGPGGPDAARGRGPQPGRARALQQGDRRAPGHLSQDRRQPRRAHLHEDRRLDAGPRRACSRCSTVCCRRRSSRRAPA